MTTQPELAHDWEPTDNQGHTMQCMRCEATWFIEDPEAIDLDSPCPARRRVGVGGDSTTSVARGVVQ